MKKRSRRPREFTKGEDMAEHPLYRFYDHPCVAEVLERRGEKALRFSDFQYNFCESKPSLNSDRCPEHRNCSKCRRARNCDLKKYREWQEAFKDEKPDAFVLYGHKPNLHQDLQKLCSAGYLEKKKKGYYERIEDMSERQLAEIVKRYATKLLKRCPPELIWSNGFAHFFFYEKGVAEEYDADFRLLGTLLSAMKTVLERIALNTWLWDVAIQFRKDVLSSGSDYDKLHLRWHVLDYLKRHLSNWGMTEDRIAAEVDNVLSVDLGIDADKVRTMERDIDTTEQEIGDMRKEISKVVGIVPAGKRWSEMYESFLERTKKKSSRDTVELVKDILDREERFMENFYESSMYISPTLVPRGPAILIEFPGLPFEFSKPSWSLHDTDRTSFMHVFRIFQLSR